MADMSTCGHFVWDTIRDNKDNLVALHETRAPAWVPETEIRGTFSILLTCLVTLSACVYSAIHLNVPLETGFWHTITRKTAWVVLALVAPELVALIAMLQFRVAWQLSSDLQRLQKEAEEEKFAFGLDYAFFITMGGLRVHTSTMTRFLTAAEIQEVEGMHGGRFGGDTGDRPVWQLTPEGLFDLARLGHWIYISSEAISDRSKADGLQKSLVLLQVSWMLASCVARKTYGLPLTLLEVHTMVHVVCAFLIYALWFKKPIDIRSPEVLDYSQDREDALAYLSQRSDVSVTLLKFFPRDSEENTEENARACECGAARRVYAVDEEGQEIHITDEYLLKHQRWHAAVRIAQAVDPTTNQIKSYEGGETAFRPRNGFLDNLSSGASVDMEAGDHTVSVGLLSLCAIPVLYGGIHLTAWASDFPSGVERLLWRGSSISIMLTLVVYPWYYVLVTFYISGCSDWLEDVPFFKDHDRVRSVIKWAVTVPVTLILWLAASAVLIASIVGRFYLVVEAFISLRAVPVGVYWVPSWLKYIPHV